MSVGWWVFDFDFFFFGLITVSFQFIKIFQNLKKSLVPSYFILFLKNQNQRTTSINYLKTSKNWQLSWMNHQEHAVLWMVYFISQVFSEPWLYIRIHSSFFFWEPWLSTKEPCQWQLDLFLHVMTTKALFLFLFLVSGFKAFENFQNQRTTNSGYLKTLKELVGFVKEP